VDCNRITKSRVSGLGDSPKDISPGESESVTTTTGDGVSLSDEDDIATRFSTMDVQNPENGQTWPAQHAGYQSENTVSRPPDVQSYTSGTMQRALPTQAIDNNLQSFQAGLEPTFIPGPAPIQFLDVFDQSPWFDPLNDAVRGWDHMGPSGFPHMNSTEAYNNAPLLPFHQESIPENLTPRSKTNGDLGVQISSGEHSLIQHFLTRMKQFSTKLLESSEEDVNCTMFSNLGLFNAQLFHAIMAFAALHRAQTQDSFFEQAELRCQHATALLYEDKNAHNHLDVTISAVWFLLQYELLRSNGIIRFCDLLTHLAHILDSQDCRKSGAISTVTIRTLLSIATFDVRAMTSGGRGGQFLRSLENFLPARVLLGEPESSLGGGPLAPVAVAIPASTPLDNAAVLRLRLRCNTTHGRILMLAPPGGGPKKNKKERAKDDLEWMEIRRLLIEQHEIFERRDSYDSDFALQIATGKRVPAAQGELSSVQFIQLLALSSVYAAFIDYNYGLKSTGADRPSSPHRVFISTEECSARIIRIAWFVREIRGLSPQTVWPSLLIAAGVPSMDGIHQSWVMNTLKETDSWATHFLQTRILFEAATEARLRLQPGDVVDIVNIQAQSTGPFII
jgi:hypothetical protein